MFTSDGGVARLRIFGEAKPNWAAVSDKKVSHKRNIRPKQTIESTCTLTTVKYFYFVMR